MADPITITGLLAFYGAVLSSIGLGWNLYRDLRDRARLKVVAHLGRIGKREDGQWFVVHPDLQVEGTSKQIFIVLDVTNVGRRPVKWAGWGGAHRQLVDGKGKFIVPPIALPRMLSEGESHMEYTDDPNVIGDNVKRLFVWDASGKRWYVSSRTLKQLKEELRGFHGGS